HPSVRVHPLPPSHAGHHSPRGEGSGRMTTAGRRHAGCIRTQPLFREGATMGHFMKHGLPRRCGAVALVAAVLPSALFALPSSHTAIVTRSTTRQASTAGHEDAMTRTSAREASKQADDRTVIRPFHVKVPEEQLADLRRRIIATKWPDRELVTDQSQGVQL